jgi:hypothetical protein
MRRRLGVERGLALITAASRRERRLRPKSLQADKKPAPAASTPQAGEAAVTCKDGTSSPHGGRGACSHHGGVRGTAANDNGVAPPVTERPTPSAPSAPAQHAGPSNSPAGAATAKCKDGSMSFSKHHSGTCSHHGGVAQWLDGSQ